MASLHFLLHLLVLSLLYDCAYVNGREIRSHVHSISLRQLTMLNSQLCRSTFSGFSGNKLPLVRRHGPCSSLDATEAPNHKETLRRDMARVDFLHRKYPLSSSIDQSALPSAPSAGVTIPDGIGSSLGTLDYVVTVGYGTPPKNFSVIFDTGSDISWIQCKPCARECYPQKDPLFDPSQSSTYTNISCDSAECSLVGRNCDGSNCIYAALYGDGSHSVGYFAKDTLSLTPSNTLKNFEFGCGVMNRGSFGGVAGLIGLGKGKVSLASQAAPVYGGAFSYCLPAFNGGIGYLTIGDQYRPRDHAQYTPMITRPDIPDLYFVELVGLKVKGTSIPVPPGVFTKVGTIIDSGTVVTYLPRIAYAALRDEFRRQMTQYQMTPPYAIFDTCYNFTGLNEITIPIVAFEFANGITVDLTFFGILYSVGDSLPLSQGCLAFAAARVAGQFSVIGNVQQRSLEVIYDLERSMIGFGPQGC